MIGMLRDSMYDEVSVSHSSNAEKRTFWLRIKSREGKEEFTELDITDAKVLISLLEKAIEEAEEQ